MQARGPTRIALKTFRHFVPKNGRGETLLPNRYLFDPIQRVLLVCQIFQCSIEMKHGVKDVVILRPCLAIQYHHVLLAFASFVPKVLAVRTEHRSTRKNLILVRTRLTIDNDKGSAREAASGH